MGAADMGTVDATGVPPGGPSVRGHAAQFYGTDVSAARVALH